MKMLSSKLTSLGLIAWTWDADDHESWSNLLEKLSLRNGIKHFLNWKAQFLDYVVYDRKMDFNADYFLLKWELLDHDLVEILVERLGGSVLENLDYEDLAKELLDIFEDY